MRKLGYSLLLALLASSTSHAQEKPWRTGVPAVDAFYERGVIEDETVCHPPAQRRERQKSFVCDVVHFDDANHALILYNNDTEPVEVIMIEDGKEPRSVWKLTRT